MGSSATQVVIQQLAHLHASLRQQVVNASNGSRLQATYHVAIAQLPAQAQTLQSLYQVASFTLEPRSF